MLKKTIEILEDEILKDLKRILRNTNTTNFEKEKVSIAINLMEKGTPLSNVLRRLQITFVGKTQSPEVKSFNKNITPYLRESQILGTAFMGSASPL
ncbi:hypothetical protein [Lactococcus ileimucosae]|uniref:hypothetical protein n=1 Tax=Lactococcus ileimucosae TaxID=2941329 RepID=UPI00351633C4